MVDRYSGWPFICKLKKTSTDAVTSQIMEWFHDFGIAKIIRSDGGPQFRNTFNEFCEQHNIKHELSSPYNAPSNGHAEAAVKSMKYLLTKCDGIWGKFRPALHEWRNTPRADGISPAQLMFGRRQRTTLPVLNKAYNTVEGERNLPVTKEKKIWQNFP